MKMRAVIFVGLISLIGFATVFLFPINEIKDVYVEYGRDVRGLLLTAKGHMALADKLSENVALHDRWIDLFGGMQRISGVDMTGDRKDPAYKIENDRLSFVYPSPEPFSEAEIAGIATVKKWQTIFRHAFYS